jgi:hypothetical protein
MRFADVLHGCILTITPCTADNYQLRRQSNQVLDPDILSRYEEDLIRTKLRTHLAATYADILRRAPNATLLVLGYPQLFHDLPTGICDATIVRVRYFLNWFAGLLTSTIAQTVASLRTDGMKIQFIDPTPSWREGRHWVCEPDPWTNGLVIFTDSGSGRQWIGPGSYHPNAAGQTQLAGLVNTALHGSSSQAAIKSRITAYVASRAADGWTITDAEAGEAARQCLIQTANAGLPGDPCMHDRILFPTVRDAAGAADNDYQALRANPVWARLHYVSDAEKEKVLKRDWMDTEVPQNYCPKPRTTGMHCDEFPFYSSEMGGVWAWDGDQDSPVSSRLREIPAGENTREGNVLGGMYSKSECAMHSGTYDATTTDVISYGTPYLTIPILNPQAASATFYVC